MKADKKIYEGRRLTDKISQLKIGDILEVKHYIHRDEESFWIRILDIEIFKTFEEALTRLDINKILPINNITICEGVEIYKKYVSIKTQEADGVCMIKLERIVV